MFAPDPCLAYVRLFPAAQFLPRLFSAANTPSMSAPDPGLAYEHTRLFLAAHSSHSLKLVSPAG